MKQEAKKKPAGGQRQRLEAQLKEARAVLKGSESTLQATESQGKTLRANLDKSRLEAENKDYDFAVAEYNRRKELFNQGLMPKSDLEATEQRMKAAEVTQKTLHAAVRVREAEIEENGRNLSKAQARLIN